jgi:hypothetical protein
MKELLTNKFHLIPMKDGSYKIFSYHHLISKKLNQVLKKYDDTIFSKKGNIEAIFKVKQTELEEVKKVLKLKNT